MSTYNVQNMGGLTAASIAPISIDDLHITSNHKKFPNHKLTLNIYGANGGYIVEVKKSKSNEYSSGDAELYIIADDKDFDKEIGKIITHHQLLT